MATMRKHSHVHSVDRFLNGDLFNLYKVALRCVTENIVRETSHLGRIHNDRMSDNSTLLHVKTPLEWSITCLKDNKV